MNLDFVTSAPGGLTLRVWVQPRSSRDRIAGVHNGALKIQLTAPPVDGEANDALIRTLARWLGVARTDLRIAAGLRGRTKVVEIATATPASVVHRLSAQLDSDIPPR